MPLLEPVERDSEQLDVIPLSNGRRVEREHADRLRHLAAECLDPAGADVVARAFGKDVAHCQ